MDDTGAGLTKQIRVFLLDDHEIVRRGDRPAWQHHRHHRRGRGRYGSRRAASSPPTKTDVAILDVRLPDGNGIDVCREIRSRHARRPKCIILTSYDDDEALFAAVMAGASGYLLKQIRSRSLTPSARSPPADRCMDPAVDGQAARPIPRHPTVAQIGDRLSSPSERFST